MKNQANMTIRSFASLMLTLSILTLSSMASADNTDTFTSSCGEEFGIATDNAASNLAYALKNCDRKPGDDLICIDGAISKHDKQVQIAHQIFSKCMLGVVPPESKSAPL